ncbi:MAG: nucleotidyltransferase domain-containing protein [Candidatus Tectomicrobia bacterium]|nr:nucleotidyltransferase domain-containing protein [Candidatus Tectomicrobia bacterium]
MMTALHTEIVKQFQNELVYKLGSIVNSIIIYGSVARGDAREGSDIDIMVIVEQKDRVISEAIRVIRDQLVCDSGYTITLAIETPDNLQRMLKAGDHFILNVLEEGQVLIDQGKTFERLRKEE